MALREERKTRISGQPRGSLSGVTQELRIQISTRPVLSRVKRYIRDAITKIFRIGRGAWDYLQIDFGMGSCASIVLDEIPARQNIEVITLIMTGPRLKKQ